MVDEFLQFCQKKSWNAINAEKNLSLNFSHSLLMFDVFAVAPAVVVIEFVFEECAVAVVIAPVVAYVTIVVVSLDVIAHYCCSQDEGESYLDLCKIPYPEL